MTFDFSLDTNDDRFTSFTTQSLGGIDWVTGVSLTYDPTPGNPSSGDEGITTKDATLHLTWNLANANSFDISADFMDLDGNPGTNDPQFSAFGFSKLSNPMFALADNSEPAT